MSVPLDMQQDDVIMGTLTVRENLMFSASLRLSSNIDREQKIDRVNETIEELRLNSCADSKVFFFLSFGLLEITRQRSLFPRGSFGLAVIRCLRLHFQPY